MAQSINLFNRPNYSKKDILAIHKYAFEKDIKTLYYYFSQAHAALEKDGDNWDTCESCAD
jgi:ribonucleotide reductase alpha subunit